MDVQDVQRRLREFAEDRDWGRFHDAKNLSMALAAEAGELLEVFQWMSSEEAATIATRMDDVARAREELADVVIYAVRLADVLQIDLGRAVEDKLVLNADKYPIELSRGNATKYSRRSP